jgi:flagellar hook-basal body complex protein FliE
MSPIGTVNPLSTSPLMRIDDIQSRVGLPASGPRRVAPTDNFGQMLDGLLATVTAKDDLAEVATRSVLLGESDQLHRSVIAGAEADVAFSLMVEVRNKLLESYQELMRMQT